MHRHLHLDPFSGIAGDMMLGALIDAGAELDQVRAALEPLAVLPIENINAERGIRRGIAGVDFKVRLPTSGASTQHDRGELQPYEHTHAGGHEHVHHHHGPHRHLKDLLALIEKLDTADRAKSRAERVVRRLAQAEAAVHGMSIDKVHFHEVGAVDSIVDILGSAVALELLDIDTISSGPLPISRGYVRCDHGLMPVPAPATAMLMRDLPTVGVDRVGELVTPTGAALVAGLADTHGVAPPMKMLNIGHGLGDRDDLDVPNLLRVFVGERSVSKSSQPALELPHYAALQTPVV
jgi:uncharacterized protein (TIGR00299 family) protein